MSQRPGSEGEQVVFGSELRLLLLLAECLSSLQLVSCLRVFQYRIRGLPCSQCHSLSTPCSLLCLNTRIDTHTGVKLDRFQGIVPSHQAPTNPPLAKVSGVWVTGR